MHDASLHKLRVLAPLSMYLRVPDASRRLTPSVGRSRDRSPESTAIVLLLPERFRAGCAFGAVFPRSMVNSKTVSRTMLQLIVAETADGGQRDRSRCGWGFCRLATRARLHDIYIFCFTIIVLQNIINVVYAIRWALRLRSLDGPAMISTAPIDRYHRCRCRARCANPVPAH